MDIKNFQFNVSWAFSISALNTKIFLLTLFSHPTTSFITKGPSSIFLPNIKAACVTPRKIVSNNVLTRVSIPNYA
ncbi:hypothetical protein HanIR_Chr12g0576401 [Helianthus annuus]|nr:hypothetical protein HanIR_Chr12g0576401 [Helianthus annuus]